MDNHPRFHLPCHCTELDTQILTVQVDTMAQVSSDEALLGTFSRLFQDSITAFKDCWYADYFLHGLYTILSNRL